MTKSSTENNISSPPRSQIIHNPISSTPLGDGYVSERFHRNASFGKANTPGGENERKLGIQGRKHSNIVSPEANNVYTEGMFLEHTTYSGQRKVLLAELTSLYYRIEEDKSRSIIDLEHYTTAFYKIQLCKHLLQRILTSFPYYMDQTINFFNRQRLYDLNECETIYSKPNHEHYDHEAAGKLSTEGDNFSIRKIKNYTPQLTVPWLDKYRGFAVNIHLPTELSFREKRKRRLKEEKAQGLTTKESQDAKRNRDNDGNKQIIPKETLLFRSELNFFSMIERSDSFSSAPSSTKSISSNSSLNSFETDSFDCYKLK